MALKTFTINNGSANQALVTNGSGVLSFAAVSADYVRLATTTISGGVTSVELTTGFSDTYKIYVLYIMGVTVATNQAILRLQFGTGGGPTYATSEYKGTDFEITGNVDVSSPTLNGGNNISDGINLNGANGTNSNANYNYNAMVILNNLRSTATLYKHAYVHAAHIQTTDVWQTILGHGYNNGNTVTTAAVTAIKVLTSSGNMNTGTFVLYGIKTA